MLLFNVGRYDEFGMIVQGWGGEYIWEFNLGQAREILVRPTLFFVGALSILSYAQATYIQQKK